MALPKIVGGIVAVLVAIIVVAVVAIPIVNDTTDTMLYGSNSGSYHYTSEISSDEDYSIEFTNTGGTRAATLNGDPISYNPGGPIIMADSFVVLYDYSGLNPTIFIQYNDATFASYTVPNAGESIELTISDGTLSITGTNNSETVDVTKTYSELDFVYDESGDLVFATSSNLPAYLPIGDPLYVIQWNNPSSGYSVKITPEEMSGKTTVGISGLDGVLGSPVNTPSVSYTSDGTNYTLSSAPNGSGGYVIPVQYIAHSDNQTNANLLQVIPIIMMISVLMIAVAMLAYKGRDY